MQKKPGIRELRERAALQIKELSDASGVSTSTINRMEHKKTPVSVVLVNKVLRVINTSLNTVYEAHEIDVLLLNQEGSSQGNQQFKKPGLS